MRELALVLPDDVWLTELTGTASPASRARAAPRAPCAARSPGPRWRSSAARPSQDAVARFRHGAQGHRRRHPRRRPNLRHRRESSAAPNRPAPAPHCQTRDFIAQFQMVVAFDAAPVPSEGDGCARGEAATAADLARTRKAKAMSSANR